MTGFYLMHRGWLDHPAFGGKREPFCRRAAWAWLIENAVYQDTRIGIGRKTVTLVRGQLSYSQRFLADAWGWDAEKVRRFCLRLTEDGMIEVNSEAGQMVITICNYEEYQGDQKDVEAVSEAVARQHQGSGEANKKQGKQGKQDLGTDLTVDDQPEQPDDQGLAVSAPANDNPGKSRKAGGQTAARHARGTRVPDGDLPDEWAVAANHSREKHGFPPLTKSALDLRWESFGHYWRGVAGSKGLKLDWRATWLNDCINPLTEKKFPATAPPPPARRMQVADWKNDPRY